MEDQSTEPDSAAGTIWCVQCQRDHLRPAKPPKEPPVLKPEVVPSLTAGYYLRIGVITEDEFAMLRDLDARTDKQSPDESRRCPDSGQRTAES